MTGRHIDQGADDTLQHDPFDDDLTERVAALAPRPVPRTTLALVGLVVLVSGFVGGILVQKSYGQTAPTAAAEQPPGEPAGRRCLPGPARPRPRRTSPRRAPPPARSSWLTAPRCISTLANGDIATVKTSDSTAVAVQQSTALKDLKVGQSVTVQGTAGTDGIISATSGDREEIARLHSTCTVTSDLILYAFEARPEVVRPGSAHASILSPPRARSSYDLLEFDTRRGGATASRRRRRPPGDGRRARTLDAAGRDHARRRASAAGVDQYAAEALVADRVRGRRHRPPHRRHLRLPRQRGVRDGERRKVDILAALLLQAQDAGRDLTAAERSLADDMIRSSDNDAASALWWTHRRRGRTGPGQQAPRPDRDQPRPGGGGVSPRRRWRTWIRLVDAIADPDGPLDRRLPEFILALMRGVDPDQDWGVSAAALPAETIALKNGWMPRSNQDGRWTVNSVGWITGGGTDLTVAVMSRGHPASSNAGIAFVEHIGVARPPGHQPMSSGHSPPATRSSQVAQGRVAAAEVVQGDAYAGVAQLGKLADGVVVRGSALGDLQYQVPGIEPGSFDDRACRSGRMWSR